MIFHILMFCSCFLAQPLSSTYIRIQPPHRPHYETTVGALREIFVGSGSESALSALRTELQKTELYSAGEIDAALEAARQDFESFLKRQNIAQLPATAPIDMGDVRIDTITESMRRAALQTLPKENNRNLTLLARLRLYFKS